jgi:hypothetical protein
MTFPMIVTVFFAISAAVGFFVLLCAVLSVAYRNGVTDGYGYSREPNCPGYASAGKYLREHMVHRWPELRDR